MKQPAFVPPPLSAKQAARILAQRQIVRYWRRALILHPTAILIAPLVLRFRYWQWILIGAGVLAIIAAWTAYRRWCKEHRRFKIVVAEELMGTIIEQKIPGHTYSPFRQLSHDWLRISHLVEDEYAFPGAIDENLIYKVFSPGNIEVFHTDLTGPLGLKTENFRGAFASFTAKSRVRPRDFIVNFGDHSRSLPLYEVPGDSRIFEFRRHVRDVREDDPEYEILKRIEDLREEIAQIVDLKLLQVVCENRFILISVWVNDVFFDLPTDVKIDSKVIYQHWRRYIRVYQLLVRFLQNNFVPAKEHSEIHWY